MSSFTAYIFKTDSDTLLANARRGASGLLFGQWTSTGNPVVHVVMGKEEGRSKGHSLYEAYRLCNIGEWRTVDKNDRDGRHCTAESIYYEKQSRRDTLGKILILDVSNVAGITPYLYTPVFIQSPTQRCELRDQVGVVELLDGENPFTKDRRGHRNPSQISTMVSPPPAYQTYAVVPRSHDAGRYAPSSQTQEVRISSHQWYSNEKDLQVVVKELKRIANGELDISRDTINHDLTVMFTDNRYGRLWTVKFPPGFPMDGAKVSYKTRSSCGSDYPSLRDPKQPSFRDVRQAMERIVHHITGKGPIHWATHTREEEDWLSIAFLYELSNSVVIIKATLCCF